MEHREERADLEGARPVHALNASFHQGTRRVALSPPHPFSIPTNPRYQNPQTERVQLTVRRVHGKFFRNQRLVCYAEGIQHTFSTTPLFVAEQEVEGGFRIFNVSEESPDKLPSMVSSRACFKRGIEDARYCGQILRNVHRLAGFVEYKLTRENLVAKEEQLVSTTIYNARSLKFPVVNGTADRIVFSVIQDDTAVQKDNETVMQKETIKESVTKAPHFRSLNAPVIKHIEDDIHVIGEEHKELKVFQSKRRFTNWFGLTMHRDVESFFEKFNGRAMLPSKKNLQIMDISSGKVILQVGRLNESDFTLDFLAPYTPYQAFGVLLAQMDAN